MDRRASPKAGILIAMVEGPLRAVILGGLVPLTFRSLNSFIREEGVRHTSLLQRPQSYDVCLFLHR
jgi:hypothetical protein